MVRSNTLSALILNTPYPISPSRRVNVAGESDEGAKTISTNLKKEKQNALETLYI